MVSVVAVLILVSTRGLSAFVVSVESLPAGATVTVNGTELPGETPLLFRGDQPGACGIGTELVGFETSMTSLELEAESVERLTHELDSDYILLNLTEYPTRLLQRREIPPGSFVRLPQGRYTFTREDDLLQLEPTYPLEPLMSGLNVAIPVAALAAVASFVADIYSVEATETIVSPPTTGYFTVAGGRSGVPGCSSGW